MIESNGSASPSQNDEHTPKDYLFQADRACERGDEVLGMHLYLAAFERLSQETASPEACDAAVESLKSAWKLAYKLRERAIAEYVFERLGELLQPEELDAYAEELQDLALDKLEEFGLSRDDLMAATDLLAHEFQAFMENEQHMEEAEQAQQEADEVKSAPASAASAPQLAASTSNYAPTSRPHPTVKSIGPFKVSLPHSPSGKDAARAGGRAIPTEDAAQRTVIERISYKDLVGYNRAVDIMRKRGFGMQDDPSFQELVAMLNRRHGVDRMPATESLIFSSPAREDAARFMEATYGELGLPAIRMRMEESVQGMQVLCVMSQAGNQPKLNAQKNAFEGDGVLLLEDLDLWASPYLDQQDPDDFGGFIIASLSRGAREAVNLIQSAVEHPGVRILATMSSLNDIDPFFLDLLEPWSVIEIQLPNEQERADIWMDIAREHPSFRGVSREELVRYSANMPRIDIYLAAQDAVEEAYSESLAVRGYVPVTASNIFEKLAAYHPLESDEYHLLEEEVIKSLRDGFDDLERFANGEIN